jgi:hypothetical protein
MHVAVTMLQRDYALMEEVVDYIVKSRGKQDQLYTPRSEMIKRDRTGRTVDSYPFHSIYIFWNGCDSSE